MEFVSIGSLSILKEIILKPPRSLKKLEDLKKYGLISDKELSSLQPVVEKFNVSITPVIADLMTASQENEPIRKQFLPSVAELNEADQELIDPIGDRKYEKVKGVVHRYKDRCLLKPIHVCPIYCRFCFRKEMLGPGSQALTPDDIKIACDYIKNQPDIWEVIFTGGEPLFLKPSRLKAIMVQLAKIDHVEIIRIHTRIPIVDPSRIANELIQALKACEKTVYVILHANHPAEFTQDAILACARLVDAGIPMLSQSVLLKGVNDDVATLSSLMKTFLRHRIKPYYLHHLDLAKGVGHFRKTIKEGQQLVKSLQCSISGLCQPMYMLEIPGGGGKIPIGPSFIHKEDGTTWTMEDHTGNLQEYIERL
jgi:lysine 2,3-aminomutase